MLVAVTRRRVVGPIAVVFAVAVLVLCYRLWTDASGEEQPPDVAASPAPINPPVTPLAVEPPPAVAASEPKAARVPAGPAWYAAYASDDPYPAIMALREARQSGSFAASLRIARACVEANFKIEMRPNLLDTATNDANYQQRLQARDRLLARCSRLTGNMVLEVIAPLAGDPYGDRYRAAESVLTDSMSKSPAQIRAALDEVAAQGQLVAAAGQLSWWAIWRGKSQRDSREEFGYAVRIAELRATSSPDMAGDDSRLLLACFLDGRCGQGYEALPDRFSDETKRKILALAADIEQAFRSNDVTAITAPRVRILVAPINP